MKTKFFATALALVITLVANAQNQAIYYTPVNETMEIGFGYNPETHKCIISVIEESKENVDFNVSINTPFGNAMTNTFDGGDITVLPKTHKVNYYECNYELSHFELSQLMFLAQHNAKVNINGVEMSSQELLKNLFSTFM